MYYTIIITQLYYVPQEMEIRVMPHILFHVSRSLEETQKKWFRFDVESAVYIKSLIYFYVMFFFSTYVQDNSFLTNIFYYLQKKS